MRPNTIFATKCEATKRLKWRRTGAAYCKFRFLIFIQFLVFVVHDRKYFPYLFCFGLFFVNFEIPLFAAAFVPLRTIRPHTLRFHHVLFVASAFYIFCSIFFLLSIACYFLLFGSVCRWLFFFVLVIISFLCWSAHIFFRSAFCFRRNPLAPRVPKNAPNIHKLRIAISFDMN